MVRRRPPRRSGIIWFLVRVLLPMTILGTALVVLSGLAVGGGPTDPSTLLLRIAGGVILSGAAIAMIVIRTRRATTQPAPAYSEARLRDAWRGLTTGAILWFFPATLSFIGFAALGAPLTLDASPAETLTVVLLVLGAVLLSEAVPEELVFRGHLMSVLSERLQGWWIIVVQAGLFTAFALVLRGWAGVADFSLFLGMGIGLGYMRVVSGSVWTTVGFHAAFQTSSQLILTHDVMTFDGSTAAAMIALGAVPFGVGAILVALLVPKYPYLFVRRQ